MKNYEVRPSNHSVVCFICGSSDNGMKEYEACEQARKHLGDDPDLLATMDQIWCQLTDSDRARLNARKKGVI